MKFFIGIVPSEDIYTEVVRIQKRFGDNRLEPHITLRPPVTVLDEAKWLKAIEHECSKVLPITVELPSTGYFGKRVLFITVSSKRLNEFHDILIPSIKAFEHQEEKKQENHNFHPHLTLGRSWCGFTKHDFVKMKEMADEFLLKERVSFLTQSIRVYYKPSPGGKYEAKKDIALSDAPY